MHTSFLTCAKHANSTTSSLNWHFATCCSVNGAVSLNAAIFAAVLLASRLPSSAHVFVFVALAIQLFALLPILRDFLRVRSERAHLILTGALFVGTLGLLMASSTLLAVVYGIGSECPGDG